MMELPHPLRLPQKISNQNQKMMLPHIMELLKAIRLPHKIRLAKKMLQGETSSIDKAPSQVEAVFLYSGFFIRTITLLSVLPMLYTTIYNYYVVVLQKESASHDSF